MSRTTWHGAAPSRPLLRPPRGASQQSRELGLRRSLTRASTAIRNYNLAAYMASGT